MVALPHDDGDTGPGLQEPVGGAPIGSDAGGPLDVFMAGDDEQAKASLSAFITSLGLRPRDTGDLTMAHWLEGAGLLSMGLARYGVGSFNFSLGVNLG